jgi:hypothetical protein
MRPCCWRMLQGPEQRAGACLLHGRWELGHAVQQWPGAKVVGAAECVAALGVLRQAASRRVCTISRRDQSLRTRQH